jgi:hypothetical protein
MTQTPPTVPPDESQRTSRPIMADCSGRRYGTRPTRGDRETTAVIVCAVDLRPEGQVCSDPYRWRARMTACASVDPDA